MYKNINKTLNYYIKRKIVVKCNIRHEVDSCSASIQHDA